MFTRGLYNLFYRVDVLNSSGLFFHISRPSSSHRGTGLAKRERQRTLENIVEYIQYILATPPTVDRLFEGNFIASLILCIPHDSGNELPKSKVLGVAITRDVLPQTVKKCKFSCCIRFIH